MGFWSLLRSRGRQPAPAAPPPMSAGELRMFALRQAVGEHLAAVAEVTSTLRDAGALFRRLAGHLDAGEMIPGAAVVIAGGADAPMAARYQQLELASAEMARAACDLRWALTRAAKSGA